MSRDYLQYDLDFQFVLNPDRAWNMQKYQSLFQFMIAIPFVQQNPMAVRALAKQFYDATGTKNFEEIWPEEMTAQIQQAGMMQQQMSGVPQPPPPEQPQGPPPAGPPMSGAPQMSNL